MEQISHFFPTFAKNTPVPNLHPRLEKRYALLGNVPQKAVRGEVR